jgi:hypothetical protein
LSVALEGPVLQNVQVPAAAAAADKLLLEHANASAATVAHCYRLHLLLMMMMVMMLMSLQPVLLPLCAAPHSAPACCRSLTQQRHASPAAAAVLPGITPAR